MNEQKKLGSTTATLDRLKKSGQLAALVRARPGVVATGAQEIPLERINPDSDQPRRVFDPQQLASLAESIKAQGILQPIVITSDSIHYTKLYECGATSVLLGEERHREVDPVPPTALLV